MKYAFRLASCLTLGVVALALPAVAQKKSVPKETTVTLEAAINRAGQQRMLSQRVAKLYTQMLLGVARERAEETLQQSLKRYDDNLTALGDLTPTAKISDALTQLRSDWQPVQALAAQPPTEARVKDMVALTDIALATAQKLTALYEGQSRMVGAAIVNESGRQRMLSQRIAKLYMVAQTGVGNPRISEEMMAARREFELAHQRLKASALNDDKLKFELSIIDGQWGFFQLAIDSKPDAMMHRSVATTSERILEIMQNVTALYEQRVTR